jgi:nucleoside-diphosphate-sugar epimerase
LNLLVTGASGFVGRNLLLRAPAGFRIVALHNSDEGFPRFVDRLHRPDITPVRCDLTNPAEIAALVKEHGAHWDCGLHLAGKVDIPWSVREPKNDLLANTMPVLNLLDAARFGKFVYFSSGAVYDGSAGEVTPTTPVAPTLPYAISKLASEHYVRFFHARRKTVEKYVIVRFFGAYGPYEAPHKIYTRLIDTFSNQGQNRYSIYGDGSNLIDAMYIDDAIDAIMRILEGEHWDLTVDLAGGNPVRIDDLVHSVAAALGVAPVTLDRTSVANERNEFWGSVRGMEMLFGFRPRVGLGEGLDRFRRFLAERHGAETS